MGQNVGKFKRYEYFCKPLYIYSYVCVYIDVQNLGTILRVLNLSCFYYSEIVIGSKLNFCQYKKPKSSQTLHTGPSMVFDLQKLFFYYYFFCIRGCRRLD